MLADRLARAVPAQEPVALPAQEVTGDALPLYPGVVQQGHLALSIRSGAVLAQAPDSWTAGCSTITETRTSRSGFELAVETYLDPVTGHALAADSRVATEDPSFASLPDRWTQNTA